MKDFNWTSFTKRIAVKSSLENIYAAWTQASRLEQWFLERVVFRSEDTTPVDRLQSAPAGSTYAWYWYLEPTPLQGHILAANGVDFLQFSFEGPSIVDIRLSQAYEYVVITLTHHSIPLDDYSRQHIRLGCNNGWAFYLHNLKSIAEGGIDLRNKDARLGVMINN